MARSPDTVAVRFELTAARVEGEVSSIARQPVSSGPDAAIGHLRRRQHPADGELAYGPRREWLRVGRRIETWLTHGYVARFPDCADPHLSFQLDRHR